MYINESKWYVYPNLNKLISENKKEQYKKYLNILCNKLINSYNNFAHQVDYCHDIKINEDFIIIYRKCTFDDLDRIGIYWWEIKIEDLINYSENYNELIKTLQTTYENKSFT